MTGLNSRLFKFTVAALFVAVTAPPAGAGFFGPSTPQEKLSDAQYLAEGPGRIAKARQEIEEARAECEKTNDKACLSEVYRLYGLLESAGAVSGVIIMYGGINAKEPTPENIDRSEPYFAKALELATEAEAYDKVVNIEFLLTVNQKYRGTPLGGCVHLDRMLAAAKLAGERHPDKQMQYPPQFKTPDEWIGAMKKELGCPVE